MTRHRDEDLRLDREDRDFVERLAAHWAPPPATPAQRAAFDEALRARLGPRRRRWLWTPALAAAAAAAALWLYAAPSPRPAPLTPGASAAAAAWEDEILLSGDRSPAGDRDESELLPDDYAAIASLILDG
jgi:hypothetical protein